VSVTKGTAARGLRNLKCTGRHGAATATALVQKQNDHQPNKDSPYAEEADDGLEDAGDDERALERPHREHESLDRRHQPTVDQLRRPKREEERKHRSDPRRRERAVALRTSRGSMRSAYRGLRMMATAG
jgi:hypothetical protein